MAAAKMHAGERETNPGLAAIARHAIAEVLLEHERR